MSLVVVPVDLAEANAFIRLHHRHHDAVVGHRFSIGCVDGEGEIHGVCIVGRPVARLAGHWRDVAEVTRLATDGWPNACSMLYAAAARAAKAMGFQRIQTYTLAEEEGTSLHAAGWVEVGSTSGGQWKHTDGRPRRTDQPIGSKTRWAVQFSRPTVEVRAVPDPQDNRLALF